jgi:hypothetical protein
VSERTDGHWLETGDGPKPLVVVSGNALVGKAHTAYRAYLDHMRECPDCPDSSFQCDAAADLWRAYREARG